MASLVGYSLEQVLLSGPWAQAGPKMGPSWAQVGSPKIKKIKILKIKIRSAQNVGKVWISRKKILLAPFGPIWANFLCGPENSEKCENFAYFPWWAHGPYSLALGFVHVQGNMF